MAIPSDRSTSLPKMVERISHLNGHYILCGAGATGIHIAKELFRCGAPFVVIEQDAVAIKQLQAKLGDDLLFLQGDATEDEVLELAGIKRAQGFIAVLGEDKDNVFAILTARSLNPELRIVTRVADEENTEKLSQAGADVITDPNTTGGMRMASEMIRPEVVAFLDHMFRVSDQEEKLRLTEIPVNELVIPAFKSDQLRIADIGQHAEFLIIAIRREGKYIYRPRGGTELTGSDVLVVIATQAQLDKGRGNRL